MRVFALLVVVAGLVVIMACDTVEPECCGPIPPLPPDYTYPEQRWHVLNNIEYAYRTRRPDVYDELLNADFVFFLAPGDVGGSIPVSWGRADELDSTSRLFRSNEQSMPPGDPVCRSIRFDLVFDKDNLQWAEIQPTAYPDEKWYSTTVYYTFAVEIEPDITYIARQGAKAQFTVRNNPQNGKGHWELVELRDLVGTSLESSAASVNEATWGGIKALYSPSS